MDTRDTKRGALISFLGWSPGLRDMWLGRFGVVYGRFSCVTGERFALRGGGNFLVYCIFCGGWGLLW